MISRKRSMAIIGGGTAGIATLIIAVQRQAANIIYIFDPSPIGPGTVFANIDPDVLCNTSVDTMSIMVDNPLDFYDYLKANGLDVTSESFVPRRWVGNYLAERFREYCIIAHNKGIVIIHMPFLFLSVRINSPRYYTVMFGDELKPQSLTITDIVFCTGFGSSIIPDVFKPYIYHPTFISSPYPENTMLERIPPQSQVLILGSKLSAIDAAILLCREGHHITMISPSGYIPAVRARFMRSKDVTLDQDNLESVMMLWGLKRTMPHTFLLRREYLKYFSGLLKKHTNKSWREQISFARNYRDRLDEEIIIAEKGDSQWQDITVNFMIVMNEIYLNNTLYFVGSFHPDFMTVIHRYLQSISLPNARKLLRYMDNGSLAVQKGVVHSITHPDISSGSWLIDWGCGHKKFNAVVSATGYNSPYYFFNNKGQIVIDANGEHAKDAIAISSSLGFSHPYFKEIESIWFVGMPAHARLWAANAFFVTLNLASQVVDNIINLPGRIN